MTTLVIFAGGISRRFQKPGEPWVNKCLYPLGGRPMIEAVAEAARGLVDEIFVAPGKNEVKGYPIIEDDPRFSGPIAAVVSAAFKLDDTLIFAPCDTPYITERAFAELLKAEGTAVFVLPNGLVESHIFKADSRTVRSIADRLLKRRGRLDDVFRLSERVSYISVVEHGISPKELHNVNFREDLEPRAEVAGDAFTEDLVLEWSPPLARYMDTGSREVLWQELATYMEAGLFSMAAHVLEDLAEDNKRLGIAARALKEALGIRKSA